MDRLGCCWLWRRRFGSCQGQSQGQFLLTAKQGSAPKTSKAPARIACPFTMTSTASRPNRGTRVVWTAGEKGVFSSAQLAWSQGNASNLEYDPSRSEVETVNDGRWLEQSSEARSFDHSDFRVAFQPMTPGAGTAYCDPE
jgi:hypothetical protein